MKNLICALALIVFFSPSAFSAAISPLSVSILPPVQFPADDFSVAGLRASVFWGNHRNIYGLDVGVIGNITEQDFYGIGVSGGFNLTKGTTRAIGLQAAGVTNMNMNKTTVVGVQLAALVNYNKAASSIYGVQLSAVNLSQHTTINGLQVGLYNEALVVNGFQIGIVNRTKNLRGVQIGLVNFNHEGLFKISPILNIGF